MKCGWWWWCEVGDGDTYWWIHLLLYRDRMLPTDLDVKIRTALKEVSPLFLLPHSFSCILPLFFSLWPLVLSSLSILHDCLKFHSILSFPFLPYPFSSLPLQTLCSTVSLQRPPSSPSLPFHLLRLLPFSIHSFHCVHSPYRASTPLLSLQPQEPLLLVHLTHWTRLQMSVRDMASGFTLMWVAYFILVYFILAYFILAYFILAYFILAYFILAWLWSCGQIYC